MSAQPASIAIATDLPAYCTPVPLDKCYRLLNHGPTVLVSAQHGTQVNVMAAAWACALDFNPPKVTVVLDKACRTRDLVQASGRLVLQLPTQAQAALTVAVGSHSAHQMPDKLAQCEVQLFAAPGSGAAMVQGCAAWLECRVLPEPHNEQTYDLFIAQVTAAWADARVFRDGHWQFEHAPDALRTLHYVAGGHFYATGQAVDVPPPSADTAT